MCKKKINNNGNSQTGMRYFLNTNICMTYWNCRLTLVRDLLCSLITLVNNLILVTHNTREFERMDGLQFEDWGVEK